MFLFQVRGDDGSDGATINTDRARSLRHFQRTTG
jgi:hypothetical protein